MSEFVEKLNLQKYENSTGNCLQYICTKFWICRKIEYPELGKFNGKLCMLYVRNIRICRKIECLELDKFNGKLCTLYVRNVWICRKIDCPELHKFNGKLCTLYE